MTPLRFCFVLHIHQPVGNFDHVFRQHVDEVYTPFFDFLESRDLWPIGLHVSGPLLEWMGDHGVALHDRIGRLATDGRVELLSSGWYEPVLCSLPRLDRAEQLGWMREELQSRFGVTPTGLWLTERVWEPDLPADLARAGIDYALIDDHLAIRAGVPVEHLQRPIRTESDGRYVDLLAIDERLRYLIPFRPAQEIADDLRRRHAAGDTLALIGDDGEKFGGWPRTREWLYEGGWLEAFGDRMDELRDEGVLRWVKPAEVLSEIPAAGPAYLPSGSYAEMEGWALGGHWKGFLARYPEANRMHKRMLALSHLSRDQGDPPEVRRAVGRAQCNDAYWHGVFGGLYMKHLREGVRRQLMRAEALLRVDAPLAWERADVDGDGHDEWWAHGARVSAWVASGGEVTDLLWLDEQTDVLDVLTRYREAYHHEALRREPQADDGASTPSIHDIEGAAILERLPPTDADTRVLVRDRVLHAGTNYEAYHEGDYDPVWAGHDYRGGDPVRGVDPNRGVDPDGGVNPEGSVNPSEGRLVWTFATETGPRVNKTLTIQDDGSVSHEWNWDPAAFEADVFFAPEVSLGAAVDVVMNPETDVWRYPIVTTSKCPDGFEEIEQGQSITPLWPIALGRASLEIRRSER